MQISPKSVNLLTIDYVAEIHRFKKEKNAIILAHYYQEEPIQSIADFLGDSLYLAQQAEKAKADIIVFAGVHFMAETAKIINPKKGLTTRFKSRLLFSRFLSSK